MGTIQFNTNTNRTVSQVYGKPWYVEFLNGGTVSYLKPEETTVSSLLYKAMQIATPPKEIYNGIGMGIPDAESDAIFGVGNRSNAKYRTLPTSLVDNGHRAWVIEKKWSEGGGEGWFGPRSQFTAFIAGFWMDEAAAIRWAEGLLVHPLLQRLLTQEIKYNSIVYPAGMDPSQWEGVTVDDIRYSFLTKEGPFDEKLLYGEDTPVGVYKEYDIRYGRWHGHVFVHDLQKWERVTHQMSLTVTPDYRIYTLRNGVERFSVVDLDEVIPQDEYLCRRDYMEFSVFVSVEEYRSLPRWQEVQDATGAWATFWPTEGAWIRFAKRNLIKARRVQIRSEWHDPNDHSHPIFVPLTQEWAQRAWSVGATKLPEKYDMIDSSTFTTRSIMDDNSYIASEQGPFRGFEKCLDLIFQDWNYHGWIRCGTGIHTVASGTVIREVGDEPMPVCGQEICVYTDGTCRVPKEFYRI